MSKHSHSPWPSSRRFKLPPGYGKPVEREIVVIELPAHGDLPYEKKLALLSDSEMSELADKVADLGAKLRAPEAGEMEDFVDQFITDSWRPQYDAGISCFRLPAPWGRPLQKV